MDLPKMKTKIALTESQYDLLGRALSYVDVCLIDGYCVSIVNVEVLYWNIFASTLKIRVLSDNGRNIGVIKDMSSDEFEKTYTLIKKE